MMMNDRMIYVHIPFCDSKCYYCNFCSFVSNDIVKKKYFEKLIKEIEHNSNKNVKISSIYIGGGTPSCVDEKFIGEILQQIKKSFILKSNAEITIELNPCSTNIKKLKYYKEIGINRVSFGIQSLNNKSLKLIGRKHNSKQAKMAIKIAKKCGFDNISVDVLIGIPKQSFLKLKTTIKKLIKLNVKHLSCYMLINEPNTKLTKMINQKKISVPSEDECVIFYNKLFKYLKSKKIFRYEISNFCKKGYECIHNIGYWTLKEYYGFGVGAHSFISNQRYSNSENIFDYINCDYNCEKENLSDREKIEEFIMLGLRTKYGINILDLKKMGFDITKEKKDDISFLINNKFITQKDDVIKICENKYGVANQIILKLLP